MNRSQIFTLAHQNALTAAIGAAREGCGGGETHRTPVKSSADALADRHYRHLEFAEVACDSHDCLLTDRQRAVYDRWLRGGDTYMGAAGTMTPLTDAPEPDDDWRSRIDMDDEGPEYFTAEDE